MTRLHDAQVASLPEAHCNDLIAWSRGGRSPLDWEPTWLLAHCDSGVVWGRREPGQPWMLSAAVFPEMDVDLSPPTVQQCRIFDVDREILIWRGDDRLHGRTLADQPSADTPPWQRPVDGQQVLLGDRVVTGPHEGFCVLEDAAGSRHAPPVECHPDRERRPRAVVDLRSYTEDTDTAAGGGVVRLAATRLSRVRPITGGGTR